MPGERSAGVTAETIEGIPLYLIPKIVSDQIRKKGEAVFRILVVRKFRHNYTVQIETLDGQAGNLRNNGEGNG